MPFSSAYLQSVLRYEQDTGLFFWLSSSWPPKERRAGCKHGQGYIFIQVDGKSYAAHRLAWLYVHGRWPVGEIDHINRQKDDNRIFNLREVDRSVNRMNVGAYCNNKTGVRGVVHRNGRFVVEFSFRKQRHWVGTFDNLDQAKTAYASAMEKLGCLSPQ